MGDIGARWYDNRMEHIRYDESAANITKQSQPINIHLLRLQPVGWSIRDGDIVGERDFDDRVQHIVDKASIQKYGTNHIC